MADFTTTTQLNGFFYEIYDKVVDPIPESAKAVARIPFKGGALELGNKLHVNVIVSDEGGFTHAAGSTGGAASAGAFTVNSAVSFETQDAQVNGFQILLQSSVDYESAAKASSSKKAFLELVGRKLQNVVASSKRRLECEMWHGQRDIGRIASSAAAVGEDVTVTLTEQSFAPFIWQGKKGHYVTVSTLAVNAVTNIAVQSPGEFYVKAVNVADGTRTVTLTGVTAGDAADLKTYVDAQPNEVRLWWGGTVTPGASPVYKSMLGINSIAANSGSMFNIDAAAYDVWAGNTVDNGAAALSFKKIMDYMSILANRGVESDIACFISNKAWSNLATDQAALRRYGAEIREAKNGAKSIEFYHMVGTLEIVGHGMCKYGEATFLEIPKWKRIGAQDFSFKTPGLEEGKDIFWHDPNKAGFSYRYYGHQAVFCEMPSHQLLVTNITNS